MRDGSVGGATRTAVRTTLLVLLATACGDGTSRPDAAVDSTTGPARVRVATVPVTPNPDVDLLFVLQDSVGGLEWQTQLKAAFPALVNVLGNRPDGLPNLHVGVVSTDLGTMGAADAQPGPSIGSGAGSCSGQGKAGELQTNGTTLLSGNFIVDTKASDGSRVVNYTGSIITVFSAIASLGASGCGFEQPLQAARRALENNPTNAGFLRASANLVVVLLTDEDDCSMSHSTLLGGDTATLGPLQSFRCTRFGVQCDDGGATTDDMSTVGLKHACHSNATSAYLMPIAPYRAFFTGLKQDPRQLYVAAITGPTEPFEVELRTPPGGGTGTPALAHSCHSDAASGSRPADPAVRSTELALSLPRSAVENICDFDLTRAVVDIGTEIRNMVGDACLYRDIALPADCEAVEVADGTETALPACTSGVRPCFDVVPDTTTCPVGQHLRLAVTRDAPAPAQAFVELRCHL